MNRCIKLLCISILAATSVHAMQDDLGEELIEAVYAGNHEEAMQLINEGAPVDYENEHGLTPLLFAAQNNSDACVRILLKANACVDQEDHNGSTALYYAAKNGNSETLKLLIAAKPSLNKPNKYGSTALIGAVMGGSLNCLKLLITAGAQVNYTNSLGWSALPWAVRYGHLDCAHELITAGAQINQACIEQLASLMHVNEADWHRYHPICELLVEAMLWVPNHEQKKRMCILLSCLKSRRTALWELYRNSKDLLRTAFAQEIYDQNKNNFMSSVAYQEVSKLEDSPFKNSLLKALLAKYSTHTNTSESSQTKRPKIA